MHAVRLVVLLLAVGCGSAQRPEPHPVTTGDGVQRGYATYYDEPQRTASGERFDPNGFTAAHRTLPLGTRVRVTNRGNGRSVIVRINDRGPFGKRDRIIDLSKAAARELHMLDAGVVPVTVEVLR
jgi:rare lipoprotein A